MQLQIRLNGISEDGKARFFVMNEGKQSSPVVLASPWDILADAEGATFRGELHWYLEEYLVLPVSPLNTRAEKVLASLSKWGRECFAALFDSGLARDWYNDARKEGLDKLRITIACDNATVLSWPWEALESGHDGILAQHCQIARQLDDVGDILPLSGELPRDSINILYIIARLKGDKVGFQTLARPLIDFRNEGSWPVHIDVLRPPTFERLQAALEEKPYHIVHFDGHGGFGENSLPGDNPGLAFAASIGALVFEDEGSEQGKKFVSGAELGIILKRHNIPAVVLNACQSAMMGDGDGDEDKVFASVAANLLKAGVRSVVAMSYSLWVSGAKVFIPVFYKELFKTGNIAAAMQAGRQNMFLKRERDIGNWQVAFHDWMVPVIYQQRDDFLPKLAPSDSPNGLEILFPFEARNLGEYGFIGRDRAIRDLERAIRRKPAGILIHGMMGEGKTTLAKGFLNWLKDTNGLGEGALWLDFGDIRSAEYIVNTIADIVVPQYGTASAARLEDKFAAVSQTLKARRYFIVWDNFESASGIPGTEATPLLPEKDRAMLKRLLQDLRGGRSKVLITSRSREDWLAPQECFPLPLGGMQGEEVWEYCNAVVSDLGLTIKRDDEDYAELINKLGGNPLAIRAILLCLQKNRSAAQLLAELDKEFKGFAGDENARRIQSVFNLLNKGLDEKLAPVFQLIGLHEHYVDADYLGYMLQDTECQESAESITDCFAILESAGFCQEVGERVYKMHPALRNCLAQAYPATETLQRKFVDLMGRLAEELAPKELHEKRTHFMLNEANFHRAMDMAAVLKMEADYMALVQIIARFKFDSRDFSQAESWYEKCGDICLEHGDERGAARTYHQLGMIAGDQRDFPSAREWYMKSLDIKLKHGDEHGAASTYHQLGIIAGEQRDFTSAREWYMKSLEISLKHGNEHRAARAYHQLGIIAEEQRDFPSAQEWHMKSLDIKLKQGDEHGAARTYHQLGMTAGDQRDFPSAREWYMKSLEISLKHGDEHGAARAYNQLGIIAQKQRDFPSAREWYMKSLDIKLKHGDEHGTALTYLNLGNLHVSKNENETAGQFYLEAIEGFMHSNDEYYSSGAIRNFARLLNSSDSPTKEKLRRLWEERGFPMELLDKMEEPADAQSGTSDPSPGGTA